MKSEDSPIFFGDPGSPEGALCPVRSREDMIRFDKWLFETCLRRAGIKITPELRAMIAEQAVGRQAELEHRFAAQGVPRKFVDLFALTRKRDVERYCRDLEIYFEEFGYLITNSEHIGYTHSAKHREFVPKHLILTSEELALLRSVKRGVPSPSTTGIFRKIKQGFVERRHVSAHLFEQADQWHCLYLTFRDCQPDIQSHWIYGPHLHYVSYLWPNARKKDIWDNLEHRKSEIHAGIHIRFVLPNQEAT